MIGDVLMIKEIHKEAARAIKKRIVADLQKKDRRYRYIVGIAGESGSGKSELAHALGKF